MMEKYQNKFFSRAGIQGNELRSDGPNKALLQSWIMGKPE
jgi:hypothetical protein